MALSQNGRTILLLAGSGFAASANLRSMDTLLPSLSSNFGVTVGQASAVITAYAVGYGICQLVIGLIGDRLGKYRIIMVLCLLSALASAGASLAASLDQLIVARFLAGVAGSGIVPLAMAWIGDNIPMAERQPVLARYMSGTITGGLMGQVIGGVLADRFGWRSALVVFAAAFLIVGIALALGDRRGARSGASPVPPTTKPLENLRALARSAYARTVVAGVLVEGTVVFGTFSFVGASLHLRFGVSLTTVGLMVACFALGGLAYSWSVGALLRVVSQRTLMASGGVFAALGLLVIGFSSSLWLMPPAIAVFGLGFYLIHNPLQVHATQMLPQARATGVSLFATCLFLSQSAGVALVAPFIDDYGIQPVCVVAAIVLLILAPSAAFVLARTKRAD